MSYRREWLAKDIIAGVAVWLMGVWARSPAGIALANANVELQASFADALPDLRHDHDGEHQESLPVSASSSRSA
jgi:hypothetical protein